MAITPWSQPQFHQAVAGHDHESVFIIESRGQVLGFAVFYQRADEGEIRNIAVREDSQGRGLGRELLGACMARMVDSEVERVFLEVRASNTAAIALYGSEGFARVGERKRYYKAADGSREDALLMTFEVER